MTPEDRELRRQLAQQRAEYGALNSRMAGAVSGGAVHQGSLGENEGSRRFQQMLKQREESDWGSELPDY